jgi:hypothetical protein
MVWPRRRLLTAAAAALLGLLPLAAVLVHNFVVIGSLFGSRAPSSLNPLQATMQGIVASGRGTLWAIDAVPGPAAALAGVLLGAVVLYAVCSKGASEPSPHGHAARLLVAAMAVTQVAVLVVARSRAEIDDLNDRLLAPASVLMLLVVVAVVGDLARADRVIIRRVAVASLAAWMVIGVAATARAVRNGNENGYSGPSWEAIRDSHALEAVPEDCRRSDVAAVLTAAADTECVVLANDPWGWYPGGVQPLMSPRRNSEFDGSSDLDRVTEAVESGVSVYVLRTSVTEPYGYLLTPDEWGANLEVEQLAVDGRLEVLRLNPGA